jgi:uncharacterized membrane protein YesL
LSGRVFALAWRDLWEEMWLLMQANVLWLVLSLPVITLPPATAGLFAVTNRLANGESARMRDFFAGFRAYFLRSWLLVLANAVLPVVIFGNFYFYLGSEGLLFVFLFGFWILAFLFWLALQPYLFPLMLEQVDKRLRVTVRNAVLMVIKGPVSTLLLLIVSAVIIALSLVFVLPVLLLTAAFLALLYNHAVLERLKPYREADTTQA